MKIRFIALAFIVAGCATNTGVLQTGPNAYDISVEREAMLGGGSAARRIAYKDAAEYCVKLGRQIQMTGERRFQSSIVSDTGLDLQFKCVPPEVAQ